MVPAFLNLLAWFYWILLLGIKESLMGKIFLCNWHLSQLIHCAEQLGPVAVGLAFRLHSPKLWRV
jgi:hypothetical protein